MTVWGDDRSPDFGHDLYMQKFNIYGNLLWASDGIPVVHITGDQGPHDVVPDGHGGCVAVWVDHRNQGYNGILYADRFSPTGQSLWYNGGEALGDPAVDYATECQAFRLDSSDTYMLRGGGTNSGAQPRFYFSHLSIFGEPPDGRFLVLDTVAVWNSFMDPEGVFKYFTGYVDSSGGRAIGRKCDMTSYQYWPNFPMIGRDILRNTEELRTDNAGGMIVVWQGSAYGEIKMARVFSDGHVGGDTTTQIDENNTQIPNHLILSQNYPNPFNLSTNIQFDIPESSDITLSIYDIIGRKVETILRRRQEAGHHEIIWNAGNLPTGIYFARITSTQSSAVIKMVYLK